MGCEVIYKVPDWVKEESSKPENIFKGLDKDPFKETVERTKAKVKPIIPRKYTFLNN